jgi:hypothetical protein
MKFFDNQVGALILTDPLRRPLLPGVALTLRDWLDRQRKLHRGEPSRYLDPALFEMLRTRTISVTPALSPADDVGINQNITSQAALRVEAIRSTIEEAMTTFTHQIEKALPAAGMGVSFLVADASEAEGILQPNDLSSYGIPGKGNRGGFVGQIAIKVSGLDPALCAQLWLVHYRSDQSDSRGAVLWRLAEPIQLVASIVATDDPATTRHRAVFPVIDANAPFIRRRYCTLTDDVGGEAMRLLEDLIGQFRERYIGRFIKRVIEERTLNERW